MRIDEGYFNDVNYTFSQVNGFNIAVGLYHNLDRSKIHNDESYGSFHLYNTEVTIDSDR